VKIVLRTNEDCDTGCAVLEVDKPLIESLWKGVEALLAARKVMPNCDSVTIYGMTYLDYYGYELSYEIDESQPGKDWADDLEDQDYAELPEGYEPKAERHRTDCDRVHISSYGQGGALRFNVWFEALWGESDIATHDIALNDLAALLEQPSEA